MLIELQDTFPYVARITWYDHVCDITLSIKETEYKMSALFRRHYIFILY